MKPPRAFLSVPSAVVTTENLFDRHDVAGGAYLSNTASANYLTVVAAKGCLAMSTMSGDGLSLATTGVQRSFTVTVRDSFGNLRPTGSDFTLSASIVSDNLPLYTANVVQPSANSVYSASYTVYESTVASRLPAELANLHESYPNAGRGVRWKNRGGYSIYVGASSIANPFSPFELTVFPNRECASTSSLQVVFRTRSIANAATTFVVQMRDQFGNNRTSSNLDANVVVLGRVVTSEAGPYPETITTLGSSQRVSAFHSAALAHSVNSGLYLGRYIMQRTSLRSSHLTYLRASIGHIGGMLATYYGSLASLDSPAIGLASPAVAAGTAVDTLDGSSALPATSGVFGARYAGFVKSTVSGVVTWAFAADPNSRVQVWVNGGAVAFSACFTSAACANTVSAVFVAASGHYYEVLVEYKGTKSSGAPMAAAAAGWGAANVYARFDPLTGSQLIPIEREAASY